MSETITIPRPDDWHVHLREGDMLQAVIGYTSRRFRYAMVMPNLSTPVATTEQAAMYLEQIREVTPPDSPDFRPLMTLYCSDQLEIDDLSHGYSEGIVKAVKYYPAGATTNSQSGGSAMMNYNHICRTNGKSIRSIYYPAGVVHSRSIVSRKSTLSTAEKRSKTVQKLSSVVSLLLKR